METEGLWHELAASKSDGKLKENHFIKLLNESMGQRITGFHVLVDYK